MRRYRDPRSWPDSSDAQVVFRSIEGLGVCSSTVPSERLERRSAELRFRAFSSVASSVLTIRSERSIKRRQIKMNNGKIVFDFAVKIVREP